MSNTSILITGATGYLGSEILKKLVEKKYEIIILKRSFSNTKRIFSLLDRIKSYDIDKIDISQVFRENNIDVVLHLATSYGKNGESEEDITYTNFIFPSKILNQSILYGTKYFINSDTVLNSNLNIYSSTKSKFYEYLKLNEKSINIFNIELEYFYGPDDYDWKFITHIMKKLLTKVPVINLTSGNQYRNFIYIQDVVDAFLLIISKKDKLEKGFVQIPLGSKSFIKIKDLVFLCKMLTNNNITKLNFGAIKDRKNETKNYTCNTLLLENLGWRCKFTLESGLDKVLKSISIKTNY